MEVVKHNDFEELIDSVYQTHNLLHQNVQKAINLNLTVRNWLIGCYIVEFEQNGEDRAKYGTRLLEEMARSLKIRRLKGLDARTLRSCRTFYNVYPQIRLIAFAELQKKLPQPIRGSVTPELPIPIWGSLTAELQEAYNQTAVIQQTLSVELMEEYPIPSKMLLSRLSFTHFVELISKDDPLERLFYEVETIKNNWSVRELERAMNTGMYFRTGLSKDNGIEN